MAGIFNRAGRAPAHGIITDSYINMPETAVIAITQADFQDPAHAQAVLDLLDEYARDPMGGGNRCRPMRGRT